MLRSSVPVRLGYFNTFVALLLQIRHRDAFSKDCLPPCLAARDSLLEGQSFYFVSTLTPKVRTEGKADGILYF